MQRIDRRGFLDRSGKAVLGATAGMASLKTARSVAATTANDKIVLAMVGIRGRGAHLARDFIARGDCEVGYLCDVDSSFFASRAEAVAEGQGGREPECVQDFRRALDDPAVDAIVVATPDHWHSLATIWGCQAEKDVYVEKPSSHNAWESQRMVEAARKYGRIVQIGTQCRSAPYIIEAKKYIDEGKLGSIHYCRVYNMKEWGNRDMLPNSEPPEGLDWDMWNGPAPEHPYNPVFHRYWNHLWRYSGGDIANDASHQIDVARWLLGVTHPKTVYSVGGRFASEGAAETPDTQVAVYEFDNLVMSFELTLYTPYMLKTDPEVRNTDMFPYWLQNATRIEIYGSEGLMIMGRHGGGWQVFVRTHQRQPQTAAEMYGRFPDPEHKENFVQCIRTRELPNADVLEGHRSALLVHYGNISYRLGGEKIEIDPATERIVGNEAAEQYFRREYRAPWVVPEEV